MIQYSINDDTFTFWTMFRGARVELLTAKPTHAGDFFRLHRLAKEEYQSLMPELIRMCA